MQGLVLCLGAGVRAREFGVQSVIEGKSWLKNLGSTGLVLFQGLGLWVSKLEGSMLFGVGRFGVLGFWV